MVRGETEILTRFMSNVQQLDSQIWEEWRPVLLALPLSSPLLSSPLLSFVFDSFVLFFSRDFLILFLRSGVLVVRYMFVVLLRGCGKGGLWSMLLVFLWERARYYLMLTRSPCNTCADIQTLPSVT